MKKMFLAIVLALISLEANAICWQNLHVTTNSGEYQTSNYWVCNLDSEKPDGQVVGDVSGGQNKVKIVSSVPVGDEVLTDSVEFSRVD